VPRAASAVSSISRAMPFGGRGGFCTTGPPPRAIRIGVRWSDALIAFGAQAHRNMVGGECTLSPLSGSRRQVSLKAGSWRRSSSPA